MGGLGGGFDGPGCRVWECENMTATSWSSGLASEYGVHLSGVYNLGVLGFVHAAMRLGGNNTGK